MQSFFIQTAKIFNKTKFFYIIPSEFKFKVIILFFLSLIGACLEVIGVGVILPVISLITDSNQIFFDIDFKSYYNNLPLLKYFGYTQVIFIILFSFFFLKFCFFLFLSWYQVTFVANFASQISKNLTQRYIFADYNLFLKKGSAELMRNVLSEPNAYIKKIFIPIIQSIMDIVILLGIMFIIFSADFKSSFILVLIYSIFTAIYFLTIKKKLYRIGLEQLNHDKLRIKSSQEAFLGIKTIKIYLQEVQFINRFIFHFEKVANLSKVASFIQQIPKYAIELLTISSFIILSLILLGNNKNFIDTVPTLALFVAAAFRIIPSVNRLTVNKQMLLTGTATQDNLYGQLKNLEKINFINPGAEKLNFSKEIFIKNLSFSYSPNLPKVLDGIDLKIKKGEAIGIIGKTGSGKTTFVDLIVGLLSPTEGQILLDGNNVSEFKRSWKNIIGYVPQETFLVNGSIKNNITFELKENINEDLLKRSLKDSAVDEFINKDIDSGVGERGINLSGGQKQRIGIARALYRNPQMIIFDESTNSLDLETEKSVMESIYNLRNKNTLIIISHRSSMLSKCDKVYEIKGQKLFQVK